jgi:zinc transport system substrate-binding protein
MMLTRNRFLSGMFAAAALALCAPGSKAAQVAKLKVGVTLHPYYSFVANIVGNRADVVPLIDADANPHGYAPQPADMVRIMSMDVLVVNGIGHDTWAFEILDAAGMRKKLKLIYANDGVSLIPVAGAPGGEKVVNPHTFISTTAAIQQVYTIARKLGELDAPNATFYRDNARKYALQIRKLRAEFDAKIAGADLSKFRHRAAAGRDHRPHQGRQGERAVRREVLRQQAVGHHPRRHRRAHVFDLAHQQRPVHARQVHR